MRAQPRLRNKRQINYNDEEDDINNVDEEDEVIDETEVEKGNKYSKKKKQKISLPICDKPYGLSNESYLLGQEHQLKADKLELKLVTFPKYKHRPISYDDFKKHITRQDILNLPNTSEELQDFFSIHIRNICNEFTSNRFSSLLKYDPIGYQKVSEIISNTNKALQSGRLSGKLYYSSTQFPKFLTDAYLIEHWTQFLKYLIHFKSNNCVIENILKERVKINRERKYYARFEIRNTIMFYFMFLELHNFPLVGWGPLPYSNDIEKPNKNTQYLCNPIHLGNVSIKTGKSILLGPDKILQYDLDESTLTDVPLEQRRAHVYLDYHHHFFHNNDKLNTVEYNIKQKEAFTSFGSLNEIYLGTQYQILVTCCILETLFYDVFQHHSYSFFFMIQEYASDHIDKEYSMMKQKDYLFTKHDPEWEGSSFKRRNPHQIHCYRYNIDTKQRNKIRRVVFRFISTAEHVINKKNPLKTKQTKKKQKKDKNENDT